MSVADQTFGKGKLTMALINQSKKILWPKGPALHQYNNPQVPWVSGRDYRMPNPVDRLDRYGGTTQWGVVTERGATKAEPGVRYEFELLVMEEYKIYCVVTGVEGGSVVRPKVALYNIGFEPKWTEYGPRIFTGEWGLEVVNPGWLTPVSVYVRYNPGQQKTAGVPPWATINYFVAGYS